MTEKVLSQNTEKELEESGHTEVSNLKKSSLLDEDLRFKTFTEQSPNMIFINKRGQIVYVNKKCEEVMGYTKEEFLSPDFDFMQLIAPESVDFMATNFRLHLSGQELAPYEYVLISKKGERLDAIITSKLIDYEGEQALLGIVTNITDRKQAEKSLQESEESYRKLISEMCNGFVLNEIELDQNGMPDECRFIEVNPAFENITGLATEDIVGKTVTEVFPGTESFWVDQCGEIAVRGNPVQFKDVSKLFGRFFEVIAYSPQKSQVAIVFTDITERVQIENALRESETNFRAIAENANDGILIAIRHGEYVYANRRASEITGYSMPELLTMSYRDLIHPDEIERVGRIYRNRRNGKSVPNSYETLIRKKDNTNRPIDVASARIVWKGQPATMVAIRDIALRKRFEEALGKINSELERRVEERTTELIDIAEKLEEKQRELLRHKLDLEKANKELVQTNTALSVLARNIDKKRDEVVKKIGQTISAQIIPLIDEIKNDNLPEKSRVKLDVLAAYLDDLTPGAAKGHDIIISLSATELRVAMMIKNGFSSDEIARLLHISPHTVKTHRRSIRKKLNITNANINLSSFLRLKLGRAVR
ncbi:MAG: PAS domain S-box protein [Desulfobacterales bacterium]|jgi:PAS domain S-box-containing protein